MADEKKKTSRPRWNVTTPQGPFNDWGGTPRVVVYRGRCVVCRRTCYGYEGEECPDPRGMIPPSHTAADYVAQDFDAAGPDVVACYSCRDTRESYEKGLRLARAQWTAPIDPSPGAYSAAELEKLPTLATGQADSLKLDDGRRRVWVCRCGLEDGARFKKGITVEQLSDGKWTTIAEYEGA